MMSLIALIFENIEQNGLYLRRDSHLDVFIDYLP